MNYFGIDDRHLATEANVHPVSMRALQYVQDGNEI